MCINVCAEERKKWRQQKNCVRESEREISDISLHLHGNNGGIGFAAMQKESQFNL